MGTRIDEVSDSRPLATSGNAGGEYAYYSIGYTRFEDGSVKVYLTYRIGLHGEMVQVPLSQPGATAASIPEWVTALQDAAAECEGLHSSIRAARA